jgi:hypothetical protein
MHLNRKCYKRQVPRPLPVLRKADELPKYLAVLSFYRRVRRIWREWLGRRTHGRWRGTDIKRSCDSIPYFYLGSSTPGQAQGGKPEEPAAGNLHGGVREGGAKEHLKARWGVPTRKGKVNSLPCLILHS